AVHAQDNKDRKTAAPPAAPPPPAPAAAAAPPAPGAAAAAPPAAPKPAPELDQLKFLMGRWRCDGKQFASPMFGPEHAFKATAENKAIADGFWDQFTYEEKKSKEHRGLKVVGLWGWDTGSKRLVRAGAGNDGTWDTATAPGLEGDKIVWTGELSNAMGRIPFRHAFTKADKGWGHVIEIKDPSGRWVQLEEVSCKR